MSRRILFIPVSVVAFALVLVSTAFACTKLVQGTTVIESIVHLNPLGRGGCGGGLVDDDPPNPATEDDPGCVYPGDAVIARGENAPGLVGVDSNAYILHFMNDSDDADTMGNMGETCMPSASDFQTSVPISNPTASDPTTGDIPPTVGTIPVTATPTGKGEAVLCFMDPSRQFATGPAYITVM